MTNVLRTFIFHAAARPMVLIYVVNLQFKNPFDPAYNKVISRNLKVPDKQSKKYLLNMSFYLFFREAV